MSEYLRSIEREPSIIEPTLIFVCGSSAVGKTTLVDYATELFKEKGIQAKRPLCYTTRQRRENEIDGVDYRFINSEDFLTDYGPQIEAGLEDWDIDRIGDDLYFIRLSDTVPDIDCPIALLPVSFTLCDDMVKKYQQRFPNLHIRVIAILLDGSNISEWETRMAAIRPTRSIAKEIDENNQFSFPENVPLMTILPSWSIEADKVQFIHTLIESLESEL